MNLNQSKHLVSFTIGNDDNNQMYFISSNYTIQDMFKAYQDTCKKTGMQLNETLIGCRDTNYTGLPEKEVTVLFNENNHLSKEHLNQLIELGYQLPDMKINKEDTYEVYKKEYYIFSLGLLDLLMWFIKESMPEDFDYELLHFNNFNNESRISIGDGLFSEE